MQMPIKITFNHVLRLCGLQITLQKTLENDQISLKVVFVKNKRNVCSFS